MEPAPNPQ